MIGMDGDMTALSSAKPFDAAFVQMMIPHHKGAIVMATYELDHGKDPQLKALARTMIAAAEHSVHLRGDGASLAVDPGLRL